jgi:hypothetical protein
MLLKCWANRVSTPENVSSGLWLHIIGFLQYRSQSTQICRSRLSLAQNPARDGFLHEPASAFAVLVSIRRLPAARYPACTISLPDSGRLDPVAWKLIFPALLALGKDKQSVLLD